LRKKVSLLSADSWQFAQDNYHTDNWRKFSLWIVHSYTFVPRKPF